MKSYKESIELKYGVEEESLCAGWYSKPRCLIQMVRHKVLTKAEYILLDILLHLENYYTSSPKQMFFHPDKKICASRLISGKTITQARRGLARKGIIEFKKRHSPNATEYKILLDPNGYYLASKYDKESIRTEKFEERLVKRSW